MTEARRKTPGGAILYDPEVLPQVSEAMFRAGYWRSAVPVTGAFRAAGRGITRIVSDDGNEFVLRPYLRGGAIARVTRDRYLWLGEDATRAFREWRLLAKLVALRLPVPRPAAARYRRQGPSYRADLLTVRVPGIRSLADRISAAAGTAGFWRELGAAIRRFHLAGVFHADLNAYNVQLDAGDKLWLLDFDRGRIRPPGAWQQRNLDRLKRSLNKLRDYDDRVHYGRRDWEELLQGYFDECGPA